MFYFFLVEFEEGHGPEGKHKYSFDTKMIYLKDELVARIKESANKQGWTVKKAKQVTKEEYDKV